jgi:hypothetical protein
VIAVRIRHSWDLKAAPLADVYDVEEIDRVRRALVSWGISDVASDLDDVLSGQWCVEDGEAYFEFVIEEDS